MRQNFSILIIACLMKMTAFGQDPIDYQKIADDSSWTWNDEAANPLSFPQRSLGELNYEVVFRIQPREHGSRDSKSIELWKDGVLQTKFPWTLFTIHGDSLTYVLDKGRTTVVQVDLSVGKERWRSTLKDVPIPTGTLGGKKINLEASNNQILKIRVDDNGCRYLVFLRSETGKILGLKVFESCSAFRNSKETNSNENLGGMGSDNEIGGNRLPTGLDVRKMTAEAVWNWSETNASPFYSLMNGVDSNKYKISIESGKHGNATFTVRNAGDENEVFSWSGHQWTIFRISDKELIFADWNPRLSGGEIVSVDLATGEEEWRTKLDGLGPENKPDPFNDREYFNRLNVDIRPEYIAISGSETLGQYIEYKDRNTGQTLFRKVFPSEDSRPSSPADARTKR